MHNVNVILNIKKKKKEKTTLETKKDEAKKVEDDDDEVVSSGRGNDRHSAVVPNSKSRRTMDKRNGTAETFQAIG